MRKSERLRLVEMQLLRMEFEVELLNHMLASLMESNNLSKPDLDAGKWYRKRLDNLE